MESRNHINFSNVEFDRFNIHTLVSPEFLQAVQDKQDEIARVEEAKEPDSFSDLETARKAFQQYPNDQSMKDFLGEKIAEVDAIALPEYSEDYKKLAVYYAFQARVTTLAILYADKYMACLSQLGFDEAKYAEALNLSAYAQAMHPDYNKNAMFAAAVRSFNNLLANETDAAKKNYYLMQIAFAQRYLGLMARRRNDAESAQECFAHALTAQLSLLTVMPQIKIDLGETQHVIGATYTFANKKAEAKLAYEAALKYEQEFVAATGAPHFLLGITGQSLGLLYGKMGDFNAAISLLTKTLREQAAFYGTRQHADSAKTLNFLAETYLGIGMLPQAISAFIEALDMKERFYAVGDPVLVITQKMLVLAMAQDFTFDWNDSLTLADNEKKVALIKTTLARMPHHQILKFNANDQRAFGQLLYRLGAYEVHIQSNQEEAIRFLNSAKTLLTTPMDLGWVDNHLAFCHQRNVFKLNAQIKQFQPNAQTEITLGANESSVTLEDLQAQRDLAARATLVIYRTIIERYNKKEFSAEIVDNIKIGAFAFCILSYTKYETEEQFVGLTVLIETIKLYREYGLQNDGDQFARALNRLANIFEENNRMEEAKAAYEELAALWDNRTAATANPHKAKFHDSYSSYFEKTGDVNAALAQSRAAYSIRAQREPQSAFTQKNAARISALEAKLAASTLSLVNATRVGFFSPPGSHSSATPAIGTNELFASPRQGG